MFESLFKPGRIGTVEVKNRLVRSAAATNYAATDGSVTLPLLHFYEEQAAGGLGLVVVEISDVHDEWGRSASVQQLSISRDDLLPGLTRLAAGIKENGARASIQICHSGGDRLLGPSAILYPTVLGEMVTQELTIGEIDELVEAFGQAVRRAKQAGFDMIELHGGHEHLVGQFLSQRTNRRTDKYGGSLKNRMRFPLEILENARGWVGEDFPICMKISVTDYYADGITVEESVEFARELDRAGIDAIHASAGGLMTVHKTISPIYYPRGHKVCLAEAIKKAVPRIPVIAVGSITSPQLAEEVLAAGKVDFVAVTRASFADPYWPKKAREDRVEEIRPCIRCTDGCFGSIVRKAPITCTVNAELGVQYEQTLEPAAKRRKVAVVGGGPCGLEAARVAAIKGHTVTLYEKRALGGNLIEDSVPEFKKERRRLIEYFTHQLDKRGVTVKREEVTADAIVKAGFDAVILATGCLRKRPSIKGVDRDNVVDIVEVYQGKSTGQNVVLVAPAWEIGSCDAAIYLAEQGKKVKVLFAKDSFEDVLQGISAAFDPIASLSLQEVMPRRGIEMLFGLTPMEITAEGVLAVDRDGKKQTFPADTVAVVPKFVPDDSLAKTLGKRGLEVHKAGDCMQGLGRFYDNIHQGHLAARRL